MARKNSTSRKVLLKISAIKAFFDHLECHEANRFIKHFAIKTYKTAVAPEAS